MRNAKNNPMTVKFDTNKINGLTAEKVGQVKISFQQYVADHLPNLIITGKLF